MKNYKNISVSQFRKHGENIPCGTINIWHWLLKEPDCMQIINQIRSTMDKDTVRQLKEKLPCVTMSGTYSKRNYEGLIQHSGIMCIDIDGQDNPDITDVNDLKQTLSKLPYILYCGLSVSGKGVFCLVPIAYSDKHKEHFYAIEQDFQEMDIIIDSSCKDITRLRYRSYDPKPIINLQATVYEKYTETSSAVGMPRTQQKKTATDTSTNIHIQEEEKPLSLEDYFLRPMVDVKSNKPIQVMAPLSAKQKIKNIVADVVENQIDITALRSDWIDICKVIALNFGEEGRELFHEICQFYPTYTRKDCDEKYDEILPRGYLKSVKRLSEIAAKYGL